MADNPFISGATSLVGGIVPGVAAVATVATGAFSLFNQNNPTKLNYPADLLEVNSSDYKPRYLRIGIWNYSKAQNTNDLSKAAKSQLNAGAGEALAFLGNLGTLGVPEQNVIGGAAGIQDAAAGSLLQGLGAGAANILGTRAGLSENQVAGLTALGAIIPALAQEGVNRTGALFSRSGTPFSEAVVNIYSSSEMKFTYGTNWNNSTFGGTVSSGGIVQQIFSGGMSGLESFQKTINEDIAKLSKFPNVNVTEKALIGVTRGRVFNDNTLQTFDSVAPRAFSYEFVLVPRNLKEAETIRNIIRAFKIGLLPSVDSTESLVGLLLNYPRVFTITPMIGEKPNPNIPRTKFCALKNMTVDYAPDGIFSSMQEDGMPPAVRLSMDFIELTTLTANEIINPQLSNSGDPVLNLEGAIL